MKPVLFFIIALFLASCSQTNHRAIQSPHEHCAQIKKPDAKPIDGGLGGTGAIETENCQQPKENKAAQ